MHTVLITDDSATARMITQRCLEMAGYSEVEYLQAANGKEAMEVLREKKVDLLITDMVMPVMDGKALLKGVKSSPKLNFIPVFVITSLANPALEKELNSIGVDKVIYKPISPPKIMECIEDIFGEEFK